MEDASMGGNSYNSSNNAPPSTRRNHSYTQFDRPGSSASNHTRLTTSSSGASNVMSSQGSYATPRAGNSKGGSLLQERLRERKVESARNSSVGDRGVQSSPVKGSMAREERRPSSGGMGAREGGKAMGVKQIGDQVSTLHKQNFDLKLELYHRRQRQEHLEGKLEAAEKQLSEITDEKNEMQEMNDQIVAELERRDQALEEAVQLICDLEAKVERLMQEREMVKTIDENPYSPPEDFSSSPPRLDDATPRKAVVRMPSFLSERSESTDALRSHYLGRSRSFSNASLPKLDEESMTGMDSPRLSVLSESSFLSVYGDKKLDLNDTEEQPKRHRASSSVEKWIEERPLAAVTPQRVSPDLMRRKQFLSINDVLESPLQRLEKLKHTLEKHSRPDQTVTNTKRRGRGEIQKVFTDKKSFENQHSLPPTPDTFSTNTLRHYKGSDDTLAQRGTFLNTASAFTPGLTRNEYQSTISVRPRSAGETVTSRREGHGWDTETQGDNTETASVASTASTYSPSAAYHLPPPIKRVRTPDLFNFNSSVNERDWGRDVMFNHSNAIEDEDELPVLNKRYEKVRRSSAVEPRSDDTVIQHNIRQVDPIDNATPRPDPPNRRSSLTAVSKLRKGSHSGPTAASSPISKDVGNGAMQLQLTAPTSTPTSTSKKTRLANKLFGRSNTSETQTDSSPVTPNTLTKRQHDTSPIPPPHNSLPVARQHPRTQQQQTYNPTSSRTTQSNNNDSYFDALHSHPTSTSSYNSNLPTQEDRNISSATPPPIRRSKTYAPTTLSHHQGRPSSAGAGAGSSTHHHQANYNNTSNHNTTAAAGRVKRMSGFAFGSADAGGAGDHYDVTTTGNGGGGEKKNRRRASLSVDLGVVRGLGALLGSGAGGGAGGVGGEEPKGGDDIGGGKDSKDGGGGGEGKRKWLGLRRS